MTEPEIAVIAIGVPWTFSSRLRADTMTSSSIAPACCAYATGFNGVNGIENSARVAT